MGAAVGHDPVACLFERNVRQPVVSNEGMVGDRGIERLVEELGSGPCAGAKLVDGGEAVPGELEPHGREGVGAVADDFGGQGEELGRNLDEVADKLRCGVLDHPAAAVGHGAEDDSPDFRDGLEIDHAQQRLAPPLGDVELVDGHLEERAPLRIAAGEGHGLGEEAAHAVPHDRDLLLPRPAGGAEGQHLLDGPAELRRHVGDRRPGRIAEDPELVAVADRLVAIEAVEDFAPGQWAGVDSMDEDAGLLRRVEGRGAAEAHALGELLEAEQAGKALELELPILKVAGQGGGEVRREGERRAAEGDAPLRDRIEQLQHGLLRLVEIEQCGDGHPEAGLGDHGILLGPRLAHDQGSADPGDGRLGPQSAAHPDEIGRHDLLGPRQVGDVHGAHPQIDLARVGPEQGAAPAALLPVLRNLHHHAPGGCVVGLEPGRGRMPPRLQVAPCPRSLPHRDGLLPQGGLPLLPHLDLQRAGCESERGNPPSRRHRRSHPCCHVLR